MYYNEVPILNRAFALARSGEFKSVKELEKALAAEGYARHDSQLQSRSVRKQLRLLCHTIPGAALPTPEEAGKIEV